MPLVFGGFQGTVCYLSCLSCWFQPFQGVQATCLALCGWETSHGTLCGLVHVCFNAMTLVGKFSLCEHGCFECRKVGPDLPFGTAISVNRQDVLNDNTALLVTILTLVHGWGTQVTLCRK